MYLGERRLAMLLVLAWNRQFLHYTPEKSFCVVLGGGDQDRVSLHSPGSPRTHSVDHNGLELSDPSTSVSRVPRIKPGTTTPSERIFLTV